MASVPSNPTQLTPPRVAFIDERSGAISREWYRFFLSLLTATQTNQETSSLGPDTDSLLASYEAMIAELAQSENVKPDCCASNEAVLQAEIDALSLTPPVLDALALGAIINVTPAPVTKTADFTVSAGETWIINNKSGSTCTVTLLTASLFAGRSITFQNYQAQTLVSASSNVVPQSGGSAGTAILDAVSGNWATLVSDGTNWVIMQAAAFNNLLY